MLPFSERALAASAPSNAVESPLAAVRLRRSASARFIKVKLATAIILILLLVTEQCFQKLKTSEVRSAFVRGVRYTDGVAVPALPTNQKASA